MSHEVVILPTIETPAEPWLILTPACLIIMRWINKKKEPPTILFHFRSTVSSSCCTLHAGLTHSYSPSAVRIINYVSLRRRNSKIYIYKVGSRFQSAKRQSVGFWGCWPGRCKEGISVSDKRLFLNLKQTPAGCCAEDCGDSCVSCNKTCFALVNFAHHKIGFRARRPRFRQESSCAEERCKWANPSPQHDRN